MTFRTKKLIFSEWLYSGGGCSLRKIFADRLAPELIKTVAGPWSYGAKRFLRVCRLQVVVCVTTCASLAGGDSDFVQNLWKWSYIVLAVRGADDLRWSEVCGKEWMKMACWCLLALCRSCASRFFRLLPDGIMAVAHSDRYCHRLHGFLLVLWLADDSASVQCFFA